MLIVVCSCRAVYHADCSIELKECATIGCSHTFRVKATAIWPGIKSLTLAQIDRALEWIAWKRASNVSIREPRASIFDKIDKAVKNPTLKNLGDFL